MNCEEVQELILDSLDDPVAGERRQAMESHIATCETCGSFARIHRMLDARLAAAVPAARLSAGFRTSLTQKMHRDPVSAWPDFLPDIAHLAGCAFAIILSLFLLPWYSGTVILAGVAFTAVTYLLQSVLRSSLDSLEEDA